MEKPNDRGVVQVGFRNLRVRDTKTIPHYGTTSIVQIGFLTGAP
ncbi:MAG: hypothetical protein ACRECJ_00995 [Limisphaerales bacterium]